MSHHPQASERCLPSWPKDALRVSFGVIWLIDAKGTQRWYGEYPSMYLSTSGLLQQVKAHLGT